MIDPIHELSRELARRARRALELPHTSMPSMFLWGERSMDAIQLADITISLNSTWLVVRRYTDDFDQSNFVLRLVWTGTEVDGVGTLADVQHAVDILRRHQALDDLANV